MMRILFWIALAVLVFFVVRSKLRASKVNNDAAGGPLVGSEPMVICAHCGTYVPASEAVHAQGLEYCSTAHARLPPK